MIERREFLTTIAVFGLSAYTTINASVVNADDTNTIILKGHIPSDAPDWVYIPFEIKNPLDKIDSLCTISYTYPKADNCALDIGLIGPIPPVKPPQPTKHDFLIGWAGGARDSYPIGDGFPFSLDAFRKNLDYQSNNPDAKWNVILGPYKNPPQGIDFVVTIKFDPTVKPTNPIMPEDLKQIKTPGWVRGDCHVHTIRSDGKQTIPELVKEFSTSGLDFITISEHNNPGINSLGIKYYSEEVTTRMGHYLALGIPYDGWFDWRYRSLIEAEDVFKEIRNSGGIVVAAHPFADCKACNFSWPLTDVDVIEVWNSSWDKADEQAVQAWESLLHKGIYKPIMGNSDSHTQQAPIGTAQTVMYTKSTSSKDITDAIKTGRTYVCEDSKVTVDFTVGVNSLDKRYIVSETVENPANEALNISITGSGIEGSEVRVITDQGVEFKQTYKKTQDYSDFPANRKWVYLQIRKPDGSMQAITNPIFLKNTWKNS